MFSRSQKGPLSIVDRMSIDSGMSRKLGTGQLGKFSILPARGEASAITGSGQYRTHDNRRVHRLVRCYPVWCEPCGALSDRCYLEFGWQKEGKIYTFDGGVSDENDGGISTLGVRQN